MTCAQVWQWRRGAWNNASSYTLLRITSHRCEKMAADLVSALTPFQSKWRVGQVFPLLFVRLPWLPRSVHFLFKIPSWKAACLWQPQCPLRDQANKTNWARRGCPLSCLTPCFLRCQWPLHTSTAGSTTWTPQEPSLSCRIQSYSPRRAITMAGCMDKAGLITVQDA